MECVRYYNVSGVFVTGTTSVPDAGTRDLKLKALLHKSDFKVGTFLGS